MCDSDNFMCGIIRSRSTDAAKRARSINKVLKIDFGRKYARKFGSIPGLSRSPVAVHGCVLRCDRARLDTQTSAPSRQHHPCQEHRVLQNLRERRSWAMSRSCKRRLVAGCAGLRGCTLHGCSVAALERLMRLAKPMTVAAELPDARCEVGNCRTLLL